jgi:GMP synthase (glutamine-hydrolysing)
MHETILILDFGSQYTQLIARRFRELNIYCDIQPYSHAIPRDPALKGVVLSGSPFSVLDAQAPQGPDVAALTERVPVLGICFGAQWAARLLGGKVAASRSREYGRSQLSDLAEDPLLANVQPHAPVWMSHGDSILALPETAQVLARSPHQSVAAFRWGRLYGLQFHPEVTHTQEGRLWLYNFAVEVCGCRQDWTPARFVEERVAQLRDSIGEKEEVVMAVSGGVDSTVAARLLQKAIGDRLHAVYVNNGLMRQGESEQVQEAYQAMGLNVHYVDASQAFLQKLEGIHDPEEKRRRIGHAFIDAFVGTVEEMNERVLWLGQGTIYPDVIESVNVKGPSATIKSHHNVGGLPEQMPLKVVEPLRSLFKDEVRRVGREIGVPSTILDRHPFPGPGLAIRILGAVDAQRVARLQQADAIFIEALKRHGLYPEVWQAGAVLLPVQAVGVMGDERTYEQVVALRAVTSVDGMTADWAHLPHTFLAEVSTQIINQVEGINRVVYDISSKPPATIEWE